MSGYTLTYRRDAKSIDGAVVRPDVLGALSLDEMQQRVGIAFEITGQPGDTLTLRHAPPLHRLGALMSRGTLIVEGDAGDDLGASMTGGLIHVRGSAGHRVGGPDFTSPRGMTGGEIVIEQNAGDYAGFRMRRGLLVVQGGAGASPGYRMSAGTLVVGRGPLDHPGLEMRRGTIVCLDNKQPTRLNEAFVEDSRFSAAETVALRLLFARLRQLGVPIDNATDNATFLLASGDRFELNKGELWLRAS